MKLLASLLMSAALAAPALVHAQAETTKVDLAKGEASYAGVCVACHGADGNSTSAAYPSIAQQQPEYLLRQLLDFKSGKRVDAVMQGMASVLSDEDARNVSWWLASQKAKPGFAKDQELVTLGERIWRGGVQERSIAACAACHSPNGAGIPIRYPRLSGQYADYTVKQLNDFRSGARQNLEMTAVAAKLNDREIKAVSDYIAGLR